MKKIYSIITGQLCEGTMSELEATDDWKTINQANDAIALMKHLKEICYTDSVSKTNPHVDFGRKLRKHAREDTLSSVSPKILKNYGDVTLSIDVTSVNGVRFFRSISRHLNFRTIKFIPDSKKKTLLNCIKTIAAVYAKRGFVKSPSRRQADHSRGRRGSSQLLLFQQLLTCSKISRM